MIEIKSLSGDVLFRSETAETVFQAVVEAVDKRQSLVGANLDGAYLVGANLVGANLARAYLVGANLVGANLDGAYLVGANLDGAYLVGAYLARANLDGANLDGANLAGAYLARAYLARANLDGANLARANLDGANLARANLAGAKIPMHCTWGVTHAGDVVNIGCKSKTIPEWDAWFAGTETFETERDTPKFRRIHASYLAIRAYLTHLGSEA